MINPTYSSNILDPINLIRLAAQIERGDWHENEEGLCERVQRAIKGFNQKTIQGMDSSIKGEFSNSISKIELSLNNSISNSQKVRRVIAYLSMIKPDDYYDPIDHAYKLSLSRYSYSFKTNPINDEKYLFCSIRGKLDSKTAVPGMGVAMQREMMIQSFENGCEGRFENEAAWKSLYFHFLMGMIPNEAIDRPLNVVMLRMGIFKASLGNFSEIAKCLKEDIPLTPQLESDLKNLKSMIYFAKTGVFKPLASSHEFFAEASNEEVLNSECFFQEFVERKDFSHLNFHFIPQLLEDISKNNGKLPVHTDTNEFMAMTQEGIDRWREAIDQNKVFKSFRDYSHIKHRMLSAQQKTLELIAKHN